MQKTWNIKLSFVLVILSLMLMASCAKKSVQTDVTTDKPSKVAVTAPDEDEKGTLDSPIEEETLTAEEREKALAAKEEIKQREAAAKAKEEFETSDIHFDYDSSAILDSEIADLEKKAEWLKNNPDIPVTIEGHCDERGTTEYNLALGDRRAARIKAFLVGLGIDAARLTTLSYGEEKPVDKGYNEAAWARNRRVHFDIK